MLVIDGTKVNAENSQDKYYTKGIDVIAPRLKAKNGSGTMYTKDMFTYVEEKATHKCPRGCYLFKKTKRQAQKS